jgi:hypothetical protein
MFVVKKIRVNYRNPWLYLLNEIAVIFFYCTKFHKVFHKVSQNRNPIKINVLKSYAKKFFCFIKFFWIFTLHQIIKKVNKIC